MYKLANAGSYKCASLKEILHKGDMISDEQYQGIPESDKSLFVSVMDKLVPEENADTLTPSPKADDEGEIISDDESKEPEEPKEEVSEPIEPSQEPEKSSRSGRRTGR